MKSSLLLLLGTLVFSSSLHGANITWRGGFGQSFHTVQNWELPPGSDEEGDRRVPGSGDRAIINTDAFVNILQAGSLGGIQFSGTGLLTVDVPGGTFAIGTVGGSAEFAGSVTVERGALSLGTVTFTGITSVAGGGLLSVPSLAGEAVCKGEFRFKKALVATASPAQVSGFLIAEETVVWGNVNVSVLGDFFLRAPDDFSSSPKLDFTDGGDPADSYTWSNGTLRFLRATVRRGGDSDRVFASAVVLAESTVDAPVTGLSVILFSGEVSLLESVTMHAPITYTGSAVVTIEGTACRFDGNVDAATGFHVLEQDAQFIVRQDATVEALDLDNNASVTLKPATSGGTVTLMVDNGAIDISRGRIRQELGTGILAITSTGKLRLFGPRVLDSPFAAVRCDVDNRGLIELKRNIDSPNHFADAEGTWTNHEQAIIRVHAGASLESNSGAPHIVLNFGTIEVNEQSPPIDTATTRSRIAGTLINDFGDVFVGTDAVCALSDGENRGLGDIDLATNATLQIEDPVTLGTFQYEDRDEVTRTATVNGLFHLRSDGVLTLASNSRVKLVGAGSIFPDIPSGLNVESPLTIEHLEMGGPSNAQPRFTALGSLNGAVLTVTKSFKWNGGHFIGNGAANIPGTQRVVVAAGTTVTGQGVSGSLGSFTGLRNGARLEYHGNGGTNTEFPMILSGGSEFVNETDGFFQVGGTGSINIQTSTGKFINKGTFEKVNTTIMTVGDNFVNDADGDLLVQDGVLRSVSASNLFLGHVGIGIQGKLETLAGVCRALLVDGPGLMVITGETEFEQTCTINNLQIGVAGTLGLLLDGTAEPTINIVTSCLWEGGTIFLGLDALGQINIGATATLRIVNNNPNQFFTAFESGKINNGGETTYVANSTAKVVADLSATFNNNGVFIVEGSGVVFDERFGASTFRNTGTVRFATNTAAQVTFGPKIVNEGLMQLTANQAGASVGFKNAVDQNDGEFRAGVPMDFDDPVVIRGGLFNMLSNVDIKTSKLCTVTDDGELSLSTPGTFEAAAGLVVNAGGLLSGMGEMDGNLMVTGGEVDPGRNVGVPTIGNITITGNASFDAAAKLLIHLPVDLTAPQGDSIGVTGMLALGGTLQVTQVGDPFAVQSGTFIEVAGFGSRTGQFANFVGTSTPGGAFQAQFQGNALGLVLVDDVNQADLSLAASAPQPVAGKNFKLPFNIANDGPDAAVNTVLTVTLPAGVQFVSSVPSGQAAGQTVTVNLANLARRARRVVNLTLTAPATIGSSLNFAASIAANTPDPDPADNTVNLAATVLPTTKSTSRDLLTPQAGTDTGLATLSVSSTGAVSAQFLVAGRKVRFSGKLAADGTFAKTINIRGFGAVTLNITAFDAGGVTGTLAIPGQTFDFETKNAAVSTAANPASQTGKYTALLDPDAADAEDPKGIGFGTVTVAKTGTVRIVGKLGDGTGFSISSALAPDGTVPLFTSLYKKRGVLSGEIVFRDQPGASDADGPLAWSKPNDGSPLFGAGFSADLIFTAARYAAPGKDTFISPGFAAAAGSVDIEITAGGLAEDLQFDATLDDDQKVTIPPPNPVNLSLSIVKKTGAFRGAFTPNGGRKTKFNGVFLQKGNRAGGFFRGTTETGAVTIVPD